ncbi:hypothetical protein MNBD_ALPHA11-1258 [hydrothermal vent metagenome]|uniref:HTH merR-type domain-containing protein n=1 Tax=hydrothermal vent metagenome TaxID=652676 RepID=A0A3B0TN07_9ZZZZ
MPNAKPAKANNSEKKTIEIETIAQETISDEQNLFSITELANELDISTRTIRFYESKGLLSPQRVGGTRIFQYRDRVRLLLILRGKRLGFSLKDISEYLALYDADRTHTSQIKLLQSKVDARLAKLEVQLHDLQTTIAELKKMRSLTNEALQKT